MLDSVLNRLIDLMGLISTHSYQERAVRDSALRSISTALIETDIYYKQLRSGAKRNLDTEAQLARYWSAAAIPLRHFDMKLAQICENKAEYWISPDQYSDLEIEKLGIKLEKVKEAHRKLAYSNSYRYFRRRI